MGNLPNSNSAQDVKPTDKNNVDEPVRLTFQAIKAKEQVNLHPIFYIRSRLGFSVRSRASLTRKERPKNSLSFKASTACCA